MEDARFLDEVACSASHVIRAGRKLIAKLGPLASSLRFWSA